MKLISKPFTLIVLQPTSFCNINCNYCYLSVNDRNSKGVMSDEILHKTFQSIFQSELINNSEKTQIVWHSGEPLTVPKQFYTNATRIIEFYRPNHLTISQQIITNGILIDDKWCEIFINNNIEIIVSIDGPNFLHDLQRKNRNNKGSYNNVIKGIEILKKHKIEFGVLTTITEHTLDFPEELFSFYKQMNFQNVGLNFEEVSAYNETSTLAVNLLSKIKTFITKLYNLAKNDENITIREFEKMKNFILFGDLYDIEFDTLTPLSNITIDKHGNFSTFASELLGMKHERFGDFSFGNVLTENLNNMVNNEKLKLIHEEIKKGVELCRNTCEYFEICGSSKPDAKLSANKSLPHQ